MSPRLLLGLVLGFFFMLGSWLPSPAYAARVATVDVEAVDVLAGPGRNFRTLERITQGTVVAASNQATEGYFKVRTPSGTVGFVLADSLMFALPAAPKEAAAPAAPATELGAQPQPVAPVPVVKAGGAKLPNKHVRVLGDYNFFSVGDVNDLFQANALLFGFSFGFELGYSFTQRFKALLRAERIGKSVLVRDSSTLRSYDLSVSSYPVMLGVEYRISQLMPKLTWNAALLAGMALQTSLSSTDLGSSAPNVTDQTIQGFTALAKVDANYAFNSNWSIMAELGYRLLLTAKNVPSTSVNGSELFKDQNTGAFIPLSINLSGPFVGLGAGFSF